MILIHIVKSVDRVGCVCSTRPQHSWGDVIQIPWLLIECNHSTAIFFELNLCGLGALFANVAILFLSSVCECGIFILFFDTKKGDQVTGAAQQ